MSQPGGVMKSTIFCVLMAFAVSAQARIEALFHPHDPTLQKISQWISEAQSTVDIAMYNMDTTEASPIVLELQRPEIQKRIQSGDLKIRVLFEGYGNPEGTNKKRQSLENLGADVRFLGNEKVKIHHKFAVIDSWGSQNRVITGSANWSMGSFNYYDENIIFFTQEPEVTARYQTEFNRLWNVSQEFGVNRGFAITAAPQLAPQQDIEVFFNSPRTVATGSQEPAVITDQLVRKIDSAQKEIHAASTRVKTPAILAALQRAAERGVKIQLVISQDDYRELEERGQYLLNQPNLQLRIKFYNLNVNDFIAYQMHNKYILVDGVSLMTGSFNWSFSSENLHIENLVELSGDKAQEVLPAYEANFQYVWNLGRDGYPALLSALQQRTHIACEIPQMSLTASEVAEILKLGSNCQGK